MALIAPNLDIQNSEQKASSRIYDTDSKPESLPEIPISIELDAPSFKNALSQRQFSSLENYELALDSYQIRLKETFDHLICLRHLKFIQSFWYQKETARKVLKDLRGRALLSDEVGLGKTIEACIVLKEYMQRGMVKTALILN